MKRLNSNWKLIGVSALSMFFTSIFCFTISGQGRIETDKTDYLPNEEIEVAIAGLEGGVEFEITVTTFDHKERPWINRSSLVFPKNKKAIKLSEMGQAKDGIIADPMDLFFRSYFMGDKTLTNGVFVRSVNHTYRSLIELKSQGELVDSTGIYRRFIGNDVEQSLVEYKDLKAVFYEPKRPVVNGAVLVVAGSDGGLSSAAWRAALFASYGIPSMALAYFNYQDLPQDLIEIPLEYVSSAVEYLKEEKDIENLAMLGFSKGSELTLAYCSIFENNRIDAIVAMSPSGYVWQGINQNVDVKSSWSLGGEPLDFIPWKYNEQVISMLRSREPKRFRTLYEFSLESEENKEMIIRSALALEKSNAPILIVTGTDDGSWPADKMMKSFVDRVAKKENPNEVRIVNFPDAGHLIFFDYLPITDSQIRGGQNFGGTLSGNMDARRKAWPLVFEFLLDKLK